MNFFRILLILFFLVFGNSVLADNHDSQNQDEEVPLNDPFAGSEASSSSSGMTMTVENEEDENSLFKFKLVGLISGKENSYISLVDSGGEVTTLTIGQYLGKIKLIDLRISEAIFEKEDKSYMIIDFNNSIREANEY